MGENTKFSIERVYSLYSEQISDMIAYIEVYEHDLPPRITGLIGEMFSTIAVANILDDEDPTGLDDLIQSVAQAIRLHAIFVIIREIGEKEYLFNNYQYRGAMIPNTDLHVYDEVKKMKKAAVHSLADKLKYYYRFSMRAMVALVLDADSPYGIKDYFKYLIGYSHLYGFKSFNKWKEPFIPPDFLTPLETTGKDLSDDYCAFKKLLSFCEEHMSDVINTGPKSSLRSRVFVAVTSWIIPIAIGIPAVNYVIKGVVHLLNMFGK